MQEIESQKRAESGETAKTYSRKKDYYQILGLDRAASASEIRRAFRRLSLKYHPDKVTAKGADERAAAAVLFAELKEAHEVLSHEPTRREYDQMKGVDDLLADKSVDLSDIESALRRAQPGARRPPPKYYEVDVTLEELYTGCVKPVLHRRVDSVGRGTDVELKISVPRGSVGGTEFVFRNLGDSQRGSPPGDVVCVLREVAHPDLIRQGDDLVFVSPREAKPHELLLLLTVPSLFGAKLHVVVDTLALRITDEGEVCSATLRGLGMPRANAGRRTRFVSKASEKQGNPQSHWGANSAVDVGGGEASGDWAVTDDVAITKERLLDPRDVESGASSSDESGSRSADEQRDEEEEDPLEALGFEKNTVGTRQQDDKTNRHVKGERHAREPSQHVKHGKACQVCESSELLQRAIHEWKARQVAKR